VSPASPDVAGGDECLGPADAGAILQRFEERLDPARPAAGEGPVEIIGYGEVSTVLSISALPQWVCKRMAGFRDAAGVERYLGAVRRYLALLRELGVRVAETVPVPVYTCASGHVVYLLQPKLDPRTLGNSLLREADEAVLLACVDRVLACVRILLLANRTSAGGRTLTVDAQLSNWHFPVRDGEVGEATLVDVGTPFMRLDGVDEMGIECFLAPVPSPLRWLYRRARAVERYIDDYFDGHELLADLLGNFHKEGRPDRIPLVLAHVNRWLEGPGTDLGVRVLEREEVDRYYRKDARLLELFLKLRRLDRFVRTRIMRRRYNFILPGPIRR
jgi:hypothetical protein